MFERLRGDRMSLVARVQFVAALDCASDRTGTDTHGNPVAGFVPRQGRVVTLIACAGGQIGRGDRSQADARARIVAAPDCASDRRFGARRSRAGFAPRQPASVTPITIAGGQLASDLAQIVPPRGNVAGASRQGSSVIHVHHAGGVHA